MATVTRRDFLKIVAAGSGTVAFSVLGFDLAHAYEVKQRLRIAGATESHSVCPYCAVGCSLIAYTRKEPDGTVRLLQIEGDPDSPVNEGRLCPKGATAMQLATSTRRVEHPLYRAPGAKEWKQVSWDEVLDKLARNIKTSRDKTFVTEDTHGNIVNRCEGIAFAGGAAFSNEEGYVAVKVMRGLGVVFIEQQARV
ncbi:MAG TPA: twin-arginine translocation signal domain-containing protein [bacterium]|nr:twin-arginine translocation signal domain-containing protein [bacterium]